MSVCHLIFDIHQPVWPEIMAYAHLDWQLSLAEVLVVIGRGVGGHWQRCWWSLAEAVVLNSGHWQRLL